MFPFIMCDVTPYGRSHKGVGVGDRASLPWEGGGGRSTHNIYYINFCLIDSFRLFFCCCFVRHCARFEWLAKKADKSQM